MAKWRHLHIAMFGSVMTIFPASRVNLEWLFKKFPKILKDKSSNDSNLVILIKPLEQYFIIKEEVLNYLEENGWEAFSATNNFDFIAFKRKEE